MYAIADDVYMNINFNPAFVKDYRLIGFDNKVGAIKDSSSVIEGGEIGSGHSMTVAFEIIPSPFYLDEKEKSLPGQHFAKIQLNYKLPGDTISKVYESVCLNDIIPFEEIDKQHQFSSALIMFGSLLRESVYLKEISWNDIYTLALKSHNPDDIPQKEFLTLVQSAKEIYSKKTKRKRRKEASIN